VKRMTRARIAAAVAHFPEVRVASREVERRIAAAGGGYRPREGLIEAVSGIRFRHEALAGTNASDLAVAAAAKLLADAGLGPESVDLLLFASASQDMVEPATAHMVAARLGARCPVFDVKNACNSVLNAVQVGEALIGSGQYRRVLVCTGEMPSLAVRWKVADRAQFVQAFPGYTLSDSGAALLLEASDGTSGIYHRAFSADSRSWDVGTLPGGGTAHPRDDEYTYFRMDGTRLREAFEGLGRGLLDDALLATGTAWDDYAVILVHQVTAPLLDAFVRQSGVPDDRLVHTLGEHGNLASATLPAQLAQAVAHGRCGPGDRVALIGLAGGVSLGIVLATL
jgi:3-oxoacyl-[acyl-carrier-protein] synthase III